MVYLSFHSDSQFWCTRQPKCTPHKPVMLPNKMAGKRLLSNPSIHLRCTLCPIYRDLLAYIYIPVVQHKLDIIRTTVWNNHRCRKQDKKQLPTGVPEHIYNFPEQYGGGHYGYAVQEASLQEVAELSGVLDDNYDDFLDQELRQQCAALIAVPTRLSPHKLPMPTCT